MVRFAVTLAAVLAGCGQVPSGTASFVFGATSPRPDVPMAADPETTVAEGTLAVQGLTEAKRRTWKDIPYGRHPQQRLDVYGVMDGRTQRPVVVYVHGGAWYLGDKGHKMADKPRFFNDLGYVFVSVNYRLADPGLPEAQRPMHPCQAQDIARAVAWVTRNISGYGGRPTGLGLLGHSAGAHLAALVSSNPRFLSAHGLGLDVIRGVVANDTASYDLTKPDSPLLASFIRNAFGTSSEVLQDASPLRQLQSGRSTPAFLILVQGSESRVAAARTFHHATVQTDRRMPGDEFLRVSRPGYGHEQMNDAVGRSGERVVSPAIQTFFRKQLGR
ncbi:MAG: alpha/beta hydrolase [Candidatus Sericytochromatia bacterium]|nr:alpha/beta hydrolase [Candidatus Sericytochromatia bacterium]